METKFNNVRSGQVFMFRGAFYVKLDGMNEAVRLYKQGVSKTFLPSDVVLVEHED